MTDFNRIDWARKKLGLGQEASIEEIKNAYRRASLIHHPDRRGEQEKRASEEAMKDINHARDILMLYCAACRFSFEEKEVKKNLMGKAAYEHLKRFYDGWLGDLDL